MASYLKLCIFACFGISLVQVQGQAPVPSPSTPPARCSVRPGKFPLNPRTRAVTVTDQAECERQCTTDGACRAYIYTSTVVPGGTNIVCGLVETWQGERDLNIVSVTFAVCTHSCAGDVVFVVDESGSIGQAHFNNTKNYIKEVLDILAPSSDGYHIGMVTFDSQSTLHFELGHSNLDQMIDGMPYKGRGTNIVAGLVRARDDVLSVTQGPSTNRPGYRDIVVLLSDGDDNVNDNQTIVDEAAALRNLGGQDNVQIIVVGIGSNVDEADLQVIASDPSQNLYISSFSAQDLANAVTGTAQLICDNSPAPNITVTPTPDAQACKAVTLEPALHDPKDLINPGAYQQCYALMPIESSCEGTCFSRYSLALAQETENCRCCTPQSAVNVSTCALCLRYDGKWVEEPFDYIKILSCACNLCSGNPWMNANISSDAGTQKRTMATDVKADIESDVTISQVKDEINRKMMSERNKALDSQAELRGSHKNTEAYVLKECEAEEMIRSLAEPDSFYDTKRVQECVERRRAAETKPGI